MNAREARQRNPSSQPALPSDAQLQSAADRIRRLSSGIDTPDERASELATFSEEAIRRTYRILELGTDFWMSLLRLDPDRKLDEINYSASDPGWLFGRTLGAMIRSWGDIKNAQRGLLWFDSSPLLGPKSQHEPVHRSNLEPVVRLMTEKTVAEISGIVKGYCGVAWRGEEEGRMSSDGLLWLGIQAGALERERRNPQGIPESHRQKRGSAVLAFCVESEAEEESSDPTESRESIEEPKDPTKAELIGSRTATITLEKRREDLIRAQGGRDTFWRPLYSFLRRGDVVAVALAHEADASDGWGTRWVKGRPFALAVVTGPARWDQGGWWGRIGSVLLLDGPTAEDKDNEDTDKRGRDRERLRTAFRFPVGPPEGDETDELLETFGLLEGQVKGTNDLGLERTRMFAEWLGLEETGGSKRLGPRDIGELAEPIPEGFPGPWRSVDSRDLRATLAEFLEPYAATIGYYEHREFVRQGASPKQGEEGPGESAEVPWHARYPANLNIERFALVSDNLRLGVVSDSPIRSGSRTSIQRIAPAPAPDSEPPKRKHEDGAAEPTNEEEKRRIRAADAHRFSFDHYKRGMEAGRFEPPKVGEDRAKLRSEANDLTPEQERAAAFMPAIRLDPALDLEAGRLFLPGEAAEILWKKDDREDEEVTPPTHLTKNINKWFEGTQETATPVSVAAFPEAEKLDLYRATDARYFTDQGLVAEQGQIAIDPAGTRIRNVVLITSTKPSYRNNRLLIILTDDSVAAVDVGAIAWMLVAYGEELEKEHVLDVEANSLLRQRQRGSGRKSRDDSDLETNDLAEQADELAETSWKMLSRLRLGKRSK